MTGILAASAYSSAMGEISGTVTTLKTFSLNNHMRSPSYMPARDAFYFATGGFNIGLASTLRDSNSPIVTYGTSISSNPDSLKAHPTSLYIYNLSSATLAARNSDGSLIANYANWLGGNGTQIAVGLDGTRIYSSSVSQMISAPINPDGSIATASKVVLPYGTSYGSSAMGIAVDPSGNVTSMYYTGPLRLVKVSADGTTILDNREIAAPFPTPKRLVWTPDGRLLASHGPSVASYSFATDTWTVIAGNPDAQGTTNGIGTNARFIGIMGMMVVDNKLYVADYQDNDSYGRIRVVTL
jgi:hypothetical protein